MSSNPPEKPVMAAAISLSSDEDTARRLQAVEQLVSIFGFAQPVAQQAIEAVGCDVTEAYNYILDNGLGTDQGGPVTPISNCPHVESLLQISLEQLPETPQTTVCSHYHDHIRNSTNNNNNNNNHQTGQLKSETDPTGHCPSHENWLCLTCGCTRCSRYVNGHGLEHWKATSCTAAAMRSNNNNNNNNNDSDDVSSVVGHALAVSLADLSVWCHACQSYLASHQIPLLRPLIQRLEELKFQQPPPPPPPLSKKQKVTRGDEQVVVEPNQKDEEKETKSDDNDAEEDESKSGGDNGAKETHFADDDSDEDDEDEDDQGAFELDLTGPNGRNILNMIRAAAASQGIPIELILQGAQFDLDDDDDDEEEVEYPFEQRPNSLEDLAKFIQSDNCKRIVILAGAGMSVASGIPDFRSADGLYATMDPDLITATEAQRQKMRVDPSSALDQPLFLENPLPCLELNRDFILGTRNQKWKATLAHRFVELLHTKLGNKLVRLYTQNIDGLEDQCTKLPRDKVIAVHGSMDRVECALCKSESDIDDFADKVKTQIKDLSRQDPEAPTDSTPIVCSVCGCSTMKPAIVLFRSSLPTAFFDNVPDDVQDVDLLIVIGTSLRVAPANSIVWRVPRSALRVLVNRDPQGEHLGMNFDESESKRDFFAAGDCESTFLELMDHLGWTNELGSLLNHHQLPDSSAELLKERLAQLGEATGTENGDNDT